MICLLVYCLAGVIYDKNAAGRSSIPSIWTIEIKRQISWQNIQPGAKWMCFEYAAEADVLWFVIHITHCTIYTDWCNTLYTIQVYGMQFFESAKNYGR